MEYIKKSIITTYLKIFPMMTKIDEILPVLVLESNTIREIDGLCWKRMEVFLEEVEEVPLERVH